MTLGYDHEEVEDTRWTGFTTAELHTFVHALSKLEYPMPIDATPKQAKHIRQRWRRRDQLLRDCAAELSVRRVEAHPITEVR